MLVELPFAGFFLSKLLGTSADVDIHHLASLDPEVYRNLLFLKSYEGDVEELGLNFTVVNNDLGEAQASGAGAPAPARVLLRAHAGTTSERRRQVERSPLGMPFCVHTRASCCGSLCTSQLENRRTESQGSGSRPSSASPPRSACGCKAPCLSASFLEPGARWCFLAPHPAEWPSAAKPVHLGALAIFILKKKYTRDSN